MLLNLLTMRLREIQLPAQMQRPLGPPPQNIPWNNRRRQQVFPTAVELLDGLGPSEAQLRNGDSQNAWRLLLIKYPSHRIQKSQFFPVFSSPPL